MQIVKRTIYETKAFKELPQFTNETLSTTRQIGRINGDEVIGRFALFPFPPS